MKKIPGYDIHLADPAPERLAPLIAAHRSDARKILKECLNVPVMNSPILGPILCKGLEAAYGISGGLYRDEIDAWATGIDRPAQDVLAANLSYELAHVAGWLEPRLSMLKWPPVFGCTAVAVRAPRGWFHVRHMDWPVQAMRDRTIVLHATKGRRRITTVSFPAMVGVLSGMVEGQFAITLNWAPPSELPGFDFGPSFLLRHVLEEAADFAAAVELLKKTPLAAPVLFLVTGNGARDACVVERTRKEARIRKPEGGVLAMANHYLGRGFRQFNDPEYDSEERFDAALCAAAGFEGSTPAEALRILGRRPTRNSETVQRMVFCAATGEVLVRT